MKKSSSLILLLFFISLNIYAQEIPKLNIGVGYHPFLYLSNYSHSGGSAYLDRNNINLFTEIPGLFVFKKNPDFSVSPGFSFIRLNETQECGCLGIDAYSYFEFLAMSIYTKFLYTSDFIKKNNWNLGLIAGYHLYTDEKGKSETWNYDQHDEYYHVVKDIDMEGNSFFKSFYFGLTTNFQFNFERIKFIKPAIEFSFYPIYANIFDYYSGDSPKGKGDSLFVGSIVLGFGDKQKKAAQK